MDLTPWQVRLDELAQRFEVPGASLAVLHRGEVAALATGVLNKDTGVGTTVDSLFQIGSITKAYTATILLRLLAGAGSTVDTPVVELLPEFRVADPDVTAQVTVRHLLSHTSGMDGDLFVDTGRGDDCVAGYVAACADVRQIHPLGATMSYCNAGFVVLGRIVERLTGGTWDDALRRLLVEPLGLTHTVTLPEEALRYRTAIGHVRDHGGTPAVAHRWGMPRCRGPAGLICATATDVLAFTRTHLSGDDGLAAMREPQVRVPEPWSLGSRWGLGWMLLDWDGHEVYGHDGNTIGQSAYLRVIPDADLAIVLLTNGGWTKALYRELTADLLRDLAGIAMPEAPAPPATAPEVDPAGFVGVYERAGARVTVRPGEDGGLAAHHEALGALAAIFPPEDIALVPYARLSDTDTAFVGRTTGDPLWTPAVFYRLPTGEPYLHLGGRANPLVSP